MYYYKGEEVLRKKRYRKYKQQIAGKTVYFKEFGDKRRMDKRSGRYLEESEKLEIEYEANELLEFAIGTEAYGEVRWIGQTLGIDGSRKAEGLNNNYFENGRHTPLMIMVEGGTLSDESYEKLQAYMNDIKGESGQHAFIVLEMESTDGRVDFDEGQRPTVTVKDLANILQKDELFGNYLDNNRRSVQSAFRLPDLYVAYTTDYNRATAQTAMEVTEEQVFQPERKSLAWAINNRLLNEYNFKYVEAYFEVPDITNADDIMKLMTAANNAGGLTPNKAKDILYKALGESSEPFDGEWGDIPLSQQQSQGGTGYEDMMSGLQMQIEKAARNHDDEIVAVMKEVRNLLKKNFQFDGREAIIKDIEDDNGCVHGDDGKFKNKEPVGSSIESDGGGSVSVTANEYAENEIKSYIANPSKLGETTPNEKYNIFAKNGVEVKPLGRGTLKGKGIERGRWFSNQRGKRWYIFSVSS